MNDSSSHLRVLGIIEVVYGVLHAIAFLGMSAFGLLGCGACASADTFGDAMGGLFAGAAWGIGSIVVALLFGFVALTGLALANGRSWAKIATIVFAVLSVANFPLGTAFAVYALWAILADRKLGSF